VDKLSIGATYICAMGPRSAASPEDRSVYCWGDATNFRLGRSASGTVAASSALEVTQAVQAIDIASGDNASCALAQPSGTYRMFCWGNSAELLGAIGGRIVQYEMPTGRVPASVSVGLAHACVTFNDGKVRCWGLSSRLATGYPYHSSGASLNEAQALTVPVRAWSSASAGDTNLTFAGGAALQAASASADKGSYSMTCVLQGNSGTSANAVACFGAARASEERGNHGLLGHCWGARNASEVTTPGSCSTTGINYADSVGTATDLGAMPPVTLSWASGDRTEELETGTDFACARSAAGSVRCWGRASSNRLGSAISTWGSLPVATFNASGADRATDIALGETFGCMVLDHYRLRCWGTLAVPAALNTYDGRTSP
jgi:hypothetical protein